MTTLKQKIDMIENYKSIGKESKVKLEKALADNEKIQARLKVF
jgi:hypothetical protein